MQQLISLITKSTTIRTISRKVEAEAIKDFCENLSDVIRLSENEDFKTNSEILIKRLLEAEGEKVVVRDTIRSYVKFAESIQDALKKSNDAISQSAKLIGQLSKVKKLINKFLSDNYDTDE